MNAKNRTPPTHNPTNRPQAGRRPHSLLNLPLFRFQGAHNRAPSAGADRTAELAHTASCGGGAGAVVWSTCSRRVLLALRCSGLPTAESQPIGPLRTCQPGAVSDSPAPDQPGWGGNRSGTRFRRQQPAGLCDRRAVSVGLVVPGVLHGRFLRWAGGRGTGLASPCESGNAFCAAWAEAVERRRRAQALRRR